MLAREAASVRRAVEYAKRQTYGKPTADQVFFIAGDRWFNDSAASREFKTRQAFQAAAREAYVVGCDPGAADDGLSCGPCGGELIDDRGRSGAFSGMLRCGRCGARFGRPAPALG